MGHALLIVPPLLKYAAGPLLGPALLKGAATAAGHHVTVLDLNIRFVRDLDDGGDHHLDTNDRTRRDANQVIAGVCGDHARPPDGLGAVSGRFLDQLAPTITGPVGRKHRNTALTLPVSHAQVYAAAAKLALGPFGDWTRRHLEARLAQLSAPSVVGVSVLYSGQVLAALVATLSARIIWPGVPVIWGGAHVTALRDVIPGDGDFAHLVDGFVFGAAEGTFVELLDAIDQQRPWPRQIARAGAGDSIPAIATHQALPFFDDLDLYGVPLLTLPAQTCRGCAFGRCTYCTYPAIEGGFIDLGLGMLDGVVREAEPRGAAVSLKDSLLVPSRLAQIADCVAGRVPWAGCTKLHPRLDRRFLEMLAHSGCRTLEFGLETLLPESQALIGKQQSRSVLCKVLDACAGSGVHPVVNLITGFPGEDPGEAHAMREDVQNLLRSIGGDGFGQVEHNTFELERLAPIARDPRIEITGSWPWASVMDWRWHPERD